MFRTRTRLAESALRRARGARGPAQAEPWLRRACAWSPVFGDAYRAAVATRLVADDPLGAVAVAERGTRRFESDPAAWVLLGEAREAAFRVRDALVAYERALMIEERADAAMAAGRLYGRQGDHATAGARFARAYAAGAGPDALKANAAALRAAGDPDAAQQAVALWERETGLVWSD